MDLVRVLTHELGAPALPRPIRSRSLSKPSSVSSSVFLNAPGDLPRVIELMRDRLSERASSDAERVEHNVQHDAGIDAASSAAQVRKSGSEDRAGGQKRNQPVAQSERRRRRAMAQPRPKRTSSVNPRPRKVSSSTTGPTRMMSAALTANAEARAGSHPAARRCASPAPNSGSSTMSTTSEPTATSGPMAAARFHDEGTPQREHVSEASGPSDEQHNGQQGPELKQGGHRRLVPVDPILGHFDEHRGREVQQRCGSYER